MFFSIHGIDTVIPVLKCFQIASGTPVFSVQDSPLRNIPEVVAVPKLYLPSLALVTPGNGLTLFLRSQYLWKMVNSSRGRGKHLTKLKGLPQSLICGCKGKREVYGNSQNLYSASHASLKDYCLMSLHTLNASVMKLGVTFNSIHMLLKMSLYSSPVWIIRP